MYFVVCVICSDDLMLRNLRYIKGRVVSSLLFFRSVTSNCFVKTGWHEEVRRSVKFDGFFERLVEKP